MKGLFQTVQELIVNFALLTAFLFVTSQVIYKKLQLIHTELQLTEKIKLGIGIGVLGIVLMLFTVGFEQTILDFRQLAIILSALAGGFISTIVTGVIIAAMRLMGFGVITANTALAAVNSIVVAVGVGLISRTALSYWKKWLYMLAVSIVFTSIVFFINLGQAGMLPAVIYLCMMSVGGLFTAYLVQFLKLAKTYSLRMEKEATTDFLTGLSNHRTFDTNLNACVKNAIEKKELLALILIDIDHFKKINDTYGHPNGDSLLLQVGDLLKNSARNLDIVSRIGGEEFAIILRDCPHAYALTIAESIRKSMRDHLFILNDGSKIQITVSIGLASWHELNSDQWREEADNALYKAKRSGRNRVCSS